MTWISISLSKRENDVAFRDAICNSARYWRHLQQGSTSLCKIFKTCTPYSLYIQWRGLQTGKWLLTSGKWRSRGRHFYYRAAWNRKITIFNADHLGVYNSLRILCKWSKWINVAVYRLNFPLFVFSSWHVSLTQYVATLVCLITTYNFTWNMQAHTGVESSCLGKHFRMKPSV